MYLILLPITSIQSRVLFKGSKVIFRSRYRCVIRVDPGFPVGGCGPILGGVDLQCECFLVKIYAKTIELGLVGGGGACTGKFCM